MKVLVTGATGFIGRHMALRLAARGDEVTALARPTSDAWKTKILTDAGITLAGGDVTDRTTVEAALSHHDVDTVVHCAAIVRFGKVDERLMHDTNVIGTENVLGPAADAGVRRVLHTSSIAALGVVGDGDADETTEHHGAYRSAYERSKHLSSMIAAEHAEMGLHVVQAMPAIVFGRTDPNFGVFFRRYMAGKIPVLPGPDTVISLIHVEDLARGMELALDKGARGERYVFTQRNLSLQELFDAVEHATNVKGPRLRVSAKAARRAVAMAAAVSHVTPWRGRIRRESADLLGRRRGFSNRAAVERLGWEPGDFDARLADTARYYAAKYGPKDARRRLAHVLASRPEDTP